MKKPIISLLLATAITASLTGAEPAALTSEKEKASYALGVNLGGMLKRFGVSPDEIDKDLIIRGLTEAQTGRAAQMSAQEALKVLKEFQVEAQKRYAELNKKTGDEFLAANKTKEGVKIRPVTLPDGRTVELQYKILQEGTGASPATNDQVTVNYKGTLLDGTEFDSSYKRGQPAQFPLNRVIRGWTEGLQLLKPGGKAQFFIPPELAYGPSGAGNDIPANATLVFDVELISAQAPPTPPSPAPGASVPQATPQAVTSDIIKVPSKEEMDKGAKIEIIKAADLEKQQQAEREKKQGGEKP